MAVIISVVAFDLFILSVLVLDHFERKQKARAYRARQIALTFQRLQTEQPDTVITFRSRSNG